MLKPNSSYQDLEESNDCNQSALAYWKSHKFSLEQVNETCKKIDKDFMAARLIFNGASDLNVTLSTRTWERQEGHYPSVVDFFRDVAKHPICENLHGAIIVWLEDGLWQWHQKLSQSAPVFAFGRHVLDTETVLIPDPAFMDSKGYLEDRLRICEKEKTISWSEKKPTIFWRGAATGIGIENASWIETARGKLTLFARDAADSEFIDAKITKFKHLETAQQNVLIESNVTGEHVPFLDFLDYRYLLDADGYCCAWMSLFFKLMSNSLVLKIQSEYEQWYHRRLIPWVHYVPIRPDFTNIRSVYDWLKNNDDEAQKLVANTHELLANITYENAVSDTAKFCARLMDQAYTA